MVRIRFYVFFKVPEIEIPFGIQKKEFEILNPFNSRIDLIL